ncbi:Piso0_001040 [Millerozyma farinosa CBS 7064]|uniref:Piso0_001040 protein n=1 Tax=Pichia sorbitophila (strain ATCC MYA-4447 / BCRC 22081 / CBS 7064 / NBRC 10061 / NRRL Y-12695) TaxID=559304 RepID=G8YS80_PICSO|nr:Piso0_001040 [Millerozyma farinosa CBS 7064]CCE79003.1 Piso0_001040 [Millerozyma farinosa CBS 7064]
MNLFDCKAEEPDYNYAFALAIKYVLKEFEKKYNEKTLEKDENSDDAIRLQDNLYCIKHVVTFVFKKVLVHYRKESIDTAERSGLGIGSLAFNFEPILLGPKFQDHGVTIKLKTKDIIDRIEKSIHEGNNSALYVAEREDELSKKFAYLLQSTISISDGTLPQEFEESSTSKKLFKIAEFYLRGIVENLSTVLELSQATLYKIETTINELSNATDDSSLSLPKIYENYKNTMNVHMLLLDSMKVEASRNLNLVYMLREQANNLMSNQSYALSIQKYTNALDLCSTSSAFNIPQLLTNRAIAYIGLNCFPEAITDLNNAVNIDRTFTPAWTQLGYCHLYMGTSLIALKCYLMSLRSAIGYLLPENLVKAGDDLAIREYRDSKTRSILPQFVQRIVQAILLTEKRAYQQREPSQDIRATVSNVRSILAKLRALADQDDMHYFAYTSDSEDNSFRSTVQRANRARPDILNQDVAQNILASNGIETSTITLPTTPITSLERIGRDNAANGDGTARPPRASGGLPGLLNDFGDMFEGARSLPVEIGVSQENNTAGTSDNQEAPNSGPNIINRQAGNRNQENESRNVVRDVLRGFFPENLAETFGNFVPQSFSNTPGQGRVIFDSRNMRNQEPDTNQRGDDAASSNTRTSGAGSGETHTSSTNTNTAAREDGDLDMSDVPNDLD